MSYEESEVIGGDPAVALEQMQRYNQRVVGERLKMLGGPALNGAAMDDRHGNVEPSTVRPTIEVVDL